MDHSDGGVDIGGENNCSNVNEVGELLSEMSLSAEKAVKDYDKFFSEYLRKTNDEYNAYTSTSHCVGHWVGGGAQHTMDEREHSYTNGRNNGHVTPMSTPIDEHNVPSAMARDFAIEHKIFLRAILSLLNDRDKQGMGHGADSTILRKVGNLKKASRTVRGRPLRWKMKVVELKKGTFSYFNGDIKLQGSSRKDIPLSATSMECRSIKYSGGGGCVFELCILGGKRRLWMANTQEERQAWIQAIHDAMIGASVTRGDNFLEYQVEHVVGRKEKKGVNNVPSNSPYRDFLEQYLMVGTATNAAKSKDDYLDAISCLRGKSITVPVQWVKSQVDNTTDAFIETEVSSGVEQLWKDLMRDCVEINGEIISGNSFHGPDRIVGQLTQQILSSDNASLQGNHTSVHADETDRHITEAQAVSYSRDILLASDRTRSGGDSYFCAENLCLNRNLVVLCPSSSEASPISVTVSTRREQNGIEIISDANSVRHPVDAVVSVSTEYKIYTADPSGIESNDTWGALRTTFVQKFTLFGGPEGRILRGDEVVHLEML